MTTSVTETHPPVGYIELISTNRDFRFLWIGQIISLLGDWFNLIASAALVATLTQSGLAVGSLFVVRMLAPFLMSPIAGVVADRYNRKYILIISDLIRAVAVFGFLFIRDASQVWLLYTLTAVQLGISGFFFPARNAILPDIVSKRSIGTANTISSITWSVMLALGAAIGGVVSGIFGVYTAFAIDSITFIVSALVLWQIKSDTVPALDSTDKNVGAALAEYIDGLRYLGRHIDILVIAFHKAVNALLLSSAFQVIQVAIAQEIFVIGEEGGISMGLMFGMAGVGTGVGPIVARYFTHDNEQPLRKAITIGYLIGGVGLAVSAPLTSFGLVLVGTFLRGFGGGIIWVFSTQLLLQLVPGQVRGRVFATEFAFFYLTSAAGAAAAGAALDSTLTVSNIIWGMTALSLLPAILWTLWLGKSAPSPQDA